jgi:two-component system OmpR family sensor kinase
MNGGLSKLAKARYFLFPRSLRYQLLSRLLIILAGLLLVIGLFQYVFMERFIYQNRATSIQRQIQSVPGDMWERFHSEQRRGPANAFIFFPSSSVAFIDNEGTFTVLTTNGSDSENTVPRLGSGAYKEAEQRSRRDKPLLRVVKGGNGEQLVVLQAVYSPRGKSGVIQVSMSAKPLKSELYRQLLIYLALACAALFAALLLFLPSIRRTLTPLYRMVAAVERIDSGKLNERLLAPVGPLEIDRLSNSFNLMLERLEASFREEQQSKERMRRFVSDASHELRTPLTSIHGFLEVLLRGAATDSHQLEKALQSMYGESTRINKLVQDLLQLAKADSSPEALRVPSDPAALVQEMEPQLRVLAGDRTIALDLRSGTIVELDPHKFRQIVLNLYQNAVQHTDSLEGVVRLSVLPIAGGIELTVQDNGPGISPEHLPRIFERFYRVDSSRNRKQGGAGLGLAITHSLVELLGGAITANSLPGEGCSFTVSFPSVDANASNTSAGHALDSFE